MATLLIPVLHYLQLPDEPPDPQYARVFRPRIARAPRVVTGSKALTAARTALNKSELSIDGWAGAEWNALNRSVVARLRNDRAAFVTQMLAASKDEGKLATLLSKLPAELKTVERFSSARERARSVRVSGAQLAVLKRRVATPSAAQKRFDRLAGLSPSLVTSLIAPSARHLTLASVNGNLFAKLNALVATEARQASFLKKVSAVHAAMATLYK